MHARFGDDAVLPFCKETIKGRAIRGEQKERKEKCSAINNHLYFTEKRPLADVNKVGRFVV